jgi:hypothetical protein
MPTAAPFAARHRHGALKLRMGAKKEALREKREESLYRNIISACALPKTNGRLDRICARSCLCRETPQRATPKDKQRKLTLFSTIRND